MLYQLWKRNVPCSTDIELCSKWYELVNFAQLTFGFNSSLLFEAESSRQGGKYVLTGGVRKLHNVGSSRTAAVTRYCCCRGCRQTVEVRLNVCGQNSYCIYKQTTLDTDLRLAKRTNTANTMSRKARPRHYPAATLVLLCMLSHASQLRWLICFTHDYQQAHCEQEGSGGIRKRRK